MTVRNGSDNRSLNNFGDELNCLYYYFVNKDTNLRDTDYVGFVPNIQTICYNPFIEIDDLFLIASKFNIEKYGNPAEETDKVNNVFRITDNEVIEKALYKQKLEMTVSREPILNYYPYRYLLLYDGFNQPLLIKPQYLITKEIDIQVRTNVNQNGKYVLYANGYKRDYYGNLEGIVNDVPLLVPVTSSAFSQFWATSSSQFNQSFINTSIENQTSYNHNTQNMELQYNQSVSNNQISGTTSALSSLLSALTLNIGGAVNGFGGLLSSISSSYFNEKGYDLSKNQAGEIKANNDYFNEANRMATLKDYKKSPRAVVSLGNDLAFSKMKNLNGIRLYDVSLQSDTIKKLEKFYHKYGYPVNKYVDNYKIGQIRQNFNFVKMGYCDVFGDRIPKADLDIIRTVFESGVTFWNVENGVRIGDYSVNNNEKEMI